MGDESEDVMVVKVHPVIFQVIAKHCIALFIFMVAPCIDDIKFFISPTNAHKLF
jgi:hypothetical protein